MKRFSTALDYAIAFGLFIFFFDQDAMAQALDWFGNRRGYYEPPNLAPIRVFLIALSGAVGFGVGWFLSPQAKQFRLAVAAVIAGLLVLTVIANEGVLGWGLVPPMSIAAFMVGFGYWAHGAVERFLAPPNPHNLGTSEFATKDTIHAAGLCEDKGVKLGFTLEFETDTAICYPDDRHGLTCGPTRTHKGTSFVIPNCLTYPGSIVVIDPKGENALVTSEHRRAMGHEVHVFDPYQITGMETSCYNPLDEIDNGDIDLPDLCMTLADSMIFGSEREPFWTDESKAMLHGNIGKVAADPAEAGQRNLGRVRDLSLLANEGQAELYKDMLSSPHSFVCSAAVRAMQKDEKLLSNVMATLQSQTHFLDSPRIRDSLSKSDFRFSDLKTKPMTIYLVLPSDKLDSHGRVLRLLIQQALMLNAKNIEIQPKHPVLFILDEFPALGRLPMVEKAFGLMAGYGITIWAITQDLSQLKRIYGDSWETFVSNSGAIQYFGSRDKFTAEYFSALCGVTTEWSLSYAVGRSLGVTNGSSGNSFTHSKTATDSDTKTFSTVSRPLVYPDELMRMDTKRQLLLIENMDPIIGRKIPWFENPDLKDKGVNLHAEQAKNTAAE